MLKVYFHHSLLPQVQVFYTAPTLLRALMQHDKEWVTKYDRSSLRILGTVGEPINPHAWNWYNEVRQLHMQYRDKQCHEPQLVFASQAL